MSSNAVSPDNAGKSAALRELDDLVANEHQSPNPRVVIKSASLTRLGTLEDLLNLCEQNLTIIDPADFDPRTCGSPYIHQEDPGERLGPSTAFPSG